LHKPAVGNPSNLSAKPSSAQPHSLGLDPNPKLNSAGRLA